MSGQATGWVLRHGPKDRAMRAVLLPIADAANRDGEHAHPGLAAIVEGSLYSRRHVLDTLAKLVEDGWLVVEEEGRGRGHATKYGIPGVLGGPPSKGAATAPIPEPKGAVVVEKGCDPEQEKVRSGAAALCSSTVGNNVGTNAAAAGESSPAKDPHHEAAHALAKLAYEQVPAPVTPGGFPAVLGRCKTLLGAGWTPDQIAYVIVHGYVRAWSLDSMSLALTRARDEAAGRGHGGSRSAGFLKRPGQRPLVERIADALGSPPDDQPALPIGDDQ